MPPNGRTGRRCRPHHPNLTEAAILLGEDYSSVPTGQAGMERWLTRLSLEGRRSVVITGVSFAPPDRGRRLL